MRPKTLSQTGVGQTAWFPVDHVQTPFNASVSVVVNGTATYDVEHTFSNILTGETPVVFKHVTLVGQTTNQNSNYAFPIQAVRLNVTAGSGTVALTWIQGGTK